MLFCNIERRNVAGPSWRFSPCGDGQRECLKFVRQKTLLRFSLFFKYLFIDTLYMIRARNNKRKIETLFWKF